MMKTLMMTMTGFLMTKTMRMTMRKVIQRTNQAMVLKRVPLMFLDSPWPFVLLSWGASPEMSCDKKQQMNLLHDHFHFTYR